ncbi:hypothetical protein C8J56DRAFT_938733 [Mycena floridula]|nr:hypothetical protein C8J56DRAFT_938733 [Mycena floridula]
MSFTLVRKLRQRFKRTPTRDDSRSQLLSPSLGRDPVRPAQDNGSVHRAVSNLPVLDLCSVNELSPVQPVNSHGLIQTTALMSPVLHEPSSICPALVQQGLLGVSMGDVHAPMFSHNTVQQIDRISVHNHYGTQEPRSNERFTVIKEGDVFLQNESPINQYNQEIVREFTGTVMDSPKFIRSYYGNHGLKIFERQYQEFCSIPRIPYILQLYGLCRSPGLTALVFHDGPFMQKAINHCIKVTDPFEFCLQSYKFHQQMQSVNDMLIQHCGLRIRWNWQVAALDIRGNLIVQQFQKDDPQSARLVSRESEKIDRDILKCFETKSFTKENLLKYYEFLFVVGRGSIAWMKIWRLENFFREPFALLHPDIKFPEYVVNWNNCKLSLRQTSYVETERYEAGMELKLLPGPSIRVHMPISKILACGTRLYQFIYPLFKGSSENYHDPFTLWASQSLLLLQDATAKSDLAKLWTVLKRSGMVVCRINRVGHANQSKIQALVEDLDFDPDSERFLYLFSHLPSSLTRDEDTHFWARDKRGEHRVKNSIIEEAFGVTVHCRWGTGENKFPPQYYSVLHDIHKSCGFDPYSIDMAKYLGAPLVERVKGTSGLQEL